MSLLCWNCRGVGNPATVHELREPAKKFTPIVLCIVETQIDKIRVEKLKGELGYDSSYVVSSDGRSGGLGLFWNDEIKLKVSGYSKYHIDAMIDNLGPSAWRLTCVYGEAQVPERYKTWDTLRDLAGSIHSPWVVMGDFNEVLHLREHDGVGQRS